MKYLINVASILLTKFILPTIRRVTTCASAALLLLTIIGFGEDAYSGPSLINKTDQLRQVIEAHYSAIEGNRLDDAMRYYHSQSPEFFKAKENIEFGLSQYLLKTTTMTFCYAGQAGNTAVTTAKHRYLMITGIKFIEHFVDAVYLLRKEEGSWKIWSQRDSSNDVVTLPDCNQTGSILHIDI